MFSLRSFNTVALRSTTTAKRGLAVANPLGTSVSPQLAPATRTLLGPGPQNAHPRVHSIMSLPQVLSHWLLLRAQFPHDRFLATPEEGPGVNQRDLRTCVMHKPKTQTSVIQHKKLKWVRLVKGLQHVEYVRPNPKNSWCHGICSKWVGIGT